METLHCIMYRCGYGPAYMYWLLAACARCL